MNRLSVKEQILNFIFLLLLQLPLIHRITLFDKAFGFFYIGFLLLLPIGLNRVYLMLAGFFSGLLVDVFSNTPGMHAFACVFIMFLRNYWLTFINDDWRELGNLNVLSLKWTGFLGFVFPFVFLHHFILFVLENGGFHLFGLVLSKIFFSSIFSTVIIFALNFLFVSKQRRV